MIKINYQKIITEFVDTETGEIFKDERVLGEETKKTKSTRAKKPTDDDPVAKLMLLEGKVKLNNAAVELTGWEPEMKIDILFEKKGRETYPVILQKDSGNRLTKTYTISCRGSKHDNLSEYGDIFELTPYEGKEGCFRLKGNVEKEDDVIDVPEEIVDPDDSMDIEDFDLELA